ncbi:ThuA domain-containing protein [Planctomycetota bacterium]
MILDGQMTYEGHKWYETTPPMKAMLEETGRFDVTVVTSPERGQPDEDFQPDFSAYDVIVVNYDGDRWPEKTEKAFVDFVAQGGGVVSVHATDNSFPQWPAWNEINGFGGWAGRDEKSGPMIWWEDGKIKYDNSPGKGGDHGQNASWLVTVHDPQHPIMQGLPEKWMHFQDELYSKMRGPGKNMHALATGWQTPDERGTGRDELCLFTVTYGKGRVFRTTMGHDTKSVSCVGFIVTFQRGTEWAATGKVTLTEVPDDFPTEVSVSHRPINE